MKDGAELIARLRAPDVWYNRGPDYEPLTIPASAIRLEAADHIETLEARVATLSAALEFADQQSAKVETLLEPHIKWGCASEGCGKPATIRFERGGVGSYYCHACYMRIQAIPAAREASR